MKIKDEKLTLQAISYIEKCEGCKASIKSQPCTDYEARFSAFLRVVGINNAANSGGPPKKSLSHKLR